MVRLFRGRRSQRPQRHGGVGGDLGGCHHPICFFVIHRMHLWHVEDLERWSVQAPRKGGSGRRANGYLGQGKSRSRACKVKWLILYMIKYLRGETGIFA